MILKTPHTQKAQTIKRVNITISIYICFLVFQLALFLDGFGKKRAENSFFSLKSTADKTTGFDGKYTQLEHHVDSEIKYICN
jgi:hypothetical protein